MWHHQASEFGRSLMTNGAGTTRGWGGKYFIAGGAVKGGQILGQYPDDLSKEGKQMFSFSARVKPTTSWDQVRERLCMCVRGSVYLCVCLRVCVCVYVYVLSLSLCVCVYV